MTEAGSSRISFAGDNRRPATDDLMRAAVRQLHQTVESLLSLRQEHELELPLDSLYVLGLREHVACPALEALRFWPDGPR